MKRSFAFFALVCAILFGCAATAGAQSKALKKDVKKRVKELTKEGWHYQLCFQSQSTGCRQDERVDVFRGVFYSGRGD